MVEGRLALSIGAALSGLFLAAALLSLLWTPHPINEIALLERMSGPTFERPLGTDHFGRDILSLLMAGAANSLLAALLAVLIGLLVGAPIGAAAAAKGGWIDEALMRASDVAFAFPALLSAVMITAVFGPGLFNAVIAIGIFNVPVFARVARAGALSVFARDYAQAARMVGKGDARIALEHVFPNIADLLIVQATIQFALAILAEAGLSYVGLGAQPPDPSWGRMLAESQTFWHRAPHLAIFPGLAIALAVLGLNLLGDGLRDHFDPARRARRAR